MIVMIQVKVTEIQYCHVELEIDAISLVKIYLIVYIRYELTLRSISKLLIWVFSITFTLISILKVYRDLFLYSGCCHHNL